MYRSIPDDHLPLIAPRQFLTPPEKAFNNSELALFQGRKDIDAAMTPD